jgi:hypothetical protein
LGVDEREEPCAPLFDARLFILIGVDVCTKFVDTAPSVDETAPGACNETFIDFVLLNNSSLLAVKVLAPATLTEDDDVDVDVDEDDDDDDVLAAEIGEEAPVGLVIDELSFIFGLISVEGKEFNDVSFAVEMMFVKRVPD